MVAKKKRGLGKGLDALLNPRSVRDLDTIQDGDQLTTLPVDTMQRGQYQPRMDMDQTALEELAASIKSQGLIQPILVRAIGSGKQYEIIAGERRWRAAQLAGLHDVPVVIRSVDDQAAMCMALIENIQRENLNPLDEAQALQRLLAEFDMTHEQVAAAVGRSRSAVSNMLRLLELDSKVKPLLQTGELEMGHARALLGLPAREQQAIAQQVIKGGLSVRATEALVSAAKKDKDGNKVSASKPQDPNIRQLEQDLSERLGAKVGISHGKQGSGKLTVHYHSLDELDGILKRIK